MYTEASSPARIGNTATITTPCLRIPANNSPPMVFYAHGYGTTIPNLIIEVNNGSGWQSAAVFRSHPQTSNNSQWTKRTVDLKPYSGSTLKIRFKTVHLGGFDGDLAIDNINISEVLAVDLGVNHVTIGKGDCNATNSNKVTVQIENYGTNDILPNQFTLNYKLNNNAIVSELFGDTLKSDSISTFEFSTLLNSSRPNFNNFITTYSNHLLDSNKLNDTVGTAFDHDIIILPYSENFDNLPNVVCQSGSSPNPVILPKYWTSITPAWTVQSDTACSFSINQGATVTSFTGPDRASSRHNFLYIDGSSNLSWNSLLSLGCFDFSNESNISLEFNYHKYARAINGPGMGDLYIEVIDSSGLSITIDSIIGITHSNAVAPWLLKTIDLSSFSGQSVKIGIRGVTLTSSGAQVGDMAIDDINIYNPLTTAIEKVKAQQSFALYPNPNDGNFNLEATSEIVGKNYQIFDMKGSIVQQAKISNTLSQIKLNNVNKGIYFLRIEGINKVEKLVLQ